MAHKVYPEKIDFIDTVLEETKKLFHDISLTKWGFWNYLFANDRKVNEYCFRIEYMTPVGRELEKLLKIPINSFNDILIVLRLKHFQPLLQVT